VHGLSLAEARDAKTSTAEWDTREVRSTEGDDTSASEQGPSRRFKAECQVRLAATKTADQHGHLAGTWVFFSNSPLLSAETVRRW